MAKVIEIKSEKISNAELMDLFDYFRTERPKGWSVEHLQYGRSKRVFVGGRKWDVHFGVYDPPYLKRSITVSFHSYCDSRRPFKFTPKQVSSLFHFLDDVTRKLKRLGYHGKFELDCIGNDIFTGHFDKRFAGVAGIRKEIAALEKFGANLGRKKK